MSLQDAPHSAPAFAGNPRTRIEAPFGTDDRHLRNAPPSVPLLTALGRRNALETLISGAGLLLVLWWMRVISADYQSAQYRATQRVLRTPIRNVIVAEELAWSRSGRSASDVATLGVHQSASTTRDVKGSVTVSPWRQRDTMVATAPTTPDLHCTVDGGVDVPYSTIRCTNTNAED